MKISLRDIALTIGSTAVAVLAAEGIAQLFVDPSPRFITGFRLSASGYYMADEETGWVPRPNVDGVHDQEGSFETTFTTNSMGLRDEEGAGLTRERPVRVVALGDSFTWGFGVNDDEIYTSVIEELEPRIEVVNLGVTAYGLRQEINYFRKLGTSMDPDIVLLALVMNDITDPLRIRPGESVAQWMDRIGMRPAEQPDPAPEEVRPPSEESWSIGKIKPWLADHSVLYRAATDVINTNKTVVDLLVWLGIKGELAGFEELDSNLRPFLVDYPESVVESVEQTKSEILELRDIVNAAGARLLVVVVPALQAVDRRARMNSIAYTKYYDEDFDVDKPFRLMAEFGEEEEIAVLNTVSSIREAAESDSYPYLRSDMHFNPVGHRVFAGEIVEFLRANSWID